MSMFEWTFIIVLAICFIKIVEIADLLIKEYKERRSKNG